MMAEYTDKDGDTSEIEQPRNPEAYQRKWLREIERAEKYFADWQRKGETLIKLFRKQSEQEKGKRKFAMLWANTEVMKPTIYSRVPEPIIGRRFKDADPAGRIAGEIVERAALYIFEKADLDSCMRKARDDLLLPGRGTAWVRFVSDGVIAYDYVHWRDFLHSPARTWEEVTWVAKRSFMSKDQLTKRFPNLAVKDKTGASKIKSMSPDNIPKSTAISEEEKKALEGKYTVWELWDKTSQTVCFLSPTAKVPLELSKPFVNVESFWPCPKPVWATMTTDSLIPIPDYKYYQDQAEEIDDLTRRIGALTDGLKMVGFYPRGSEATTEIEQALKPGTENRMIGVESWAAFAEKGGIKAIVFLPIEEVVKTIQACVELRQQLIQDVYQITGISDIMRGATDPHETLGAQQLKAQTGSVRIRDRQQDVQRFARDMLRITAEIIAENFSPTTLIEMTNIKQIAMDQAQQPQQPPGPPPMGHNGGPSMGMPVPQMAPNGMAPPGQPMMNGGAPPPMGPMPAPGPVDILTQAFELLRSDKLRGFRIDIETDSTVQPDEDAEKQRRIEFTQALGTLFKEAIPMVQQVPVLLPLVGETMRFVTRGFRAGRQLEDVLDRTLKELEQTAKQQASAPPKPSKEDIDMKRLDAVDIPKAQAETAEIKARTVKTRSEAMVIPAKLAMEQDEMLLGEQARQEDRQDNLDARAEEGARADIERQDGLDQAETERADTLNQQGIENRQSQQEAAMRALGGNGSAGPAMPPAAPSPVQGTVARLLEALATSTQQNSQAIQQLAMVMAMPTQVQTPRGTYVARKVMQ